MTAAIPPPYWLYLLECEGGVYYAGIALDVERRFYQHLFGVGAKFTRSRRPLRVLAAREYPGKSEALRAELRLKALPRSAKVAFFSETHGSSPPADAESSGRRKAMKEPRLVPGAPQVARTDGAHGLQQLRVAGVFPGRRPQWARARGEP